MRKFLILSFALIYFGLSAGVLVSIHRCGGEIVNIDFFSSHAESCGSKACERKGCCENETHFCKIENNQKEISEVGIPLFYDDYEFVELVFPSLTSSLYSFQFLKTFPVRHPPNKNLKTPLFIHHRAILI